MDGQYPPWWLIIFVFQVIYVARNPKDAIVSFFYFHKLVKLCYFSGEMEQFVDYFINNQGWLLADCEIMAREIRAEQS